MRFAKLTLTLAMLLIAFGDASSVRASTCAEAARSAEQRRGLPAGLLGAVGAVESGGWGWSVNGNDGMPGRRFTSADAAMRFTEELLGSGQRTIDLGCFQVDLRYHPDAFQRWQDAFDGDRNADAAADILIHLHAQTGDWSRAVALYHSADPLRGQSYLQAVMNAWSGGPGLVPVVADSSVYEIELRPVFVPVAVWGPTTILSGGTARRRREGALPRVITP